MLRKANYEILRSLRYHSDKKVAVLLQPEDMNDILDIISDMNSRIKGLESNMSAMEKHIADLEREAEEPKKTYKTSDQENTRFKTRDNGPRYTSFI